MTEAASLQAKGRENSGFGRSRQDGRPRKMPSTAMTESAAVTTPLFWQSPSPDPRLGTRRYLLRRRHCWEPVRLAARQHPDLAPLVAALFPSSPTASWCRTARGRPSPCCITPSTRPGPCMPADRGMASRTASTRRAGPCRSWPAGHPNAPHRRGPPRRRALAPWLGPVVAADQRAAAGLAGATFRHGDAAQRGYRAAATGSVAVAPVPVGGASTPARHARRHLAGRPAHPRKRCRGAERKTGQTAAPENTVGQMLIDGSQGVSACYCIQIYHPASKSMALPVNDCGSTITSDFWAVRYPGSPAVTIHGFASSEIRGTERRIFPCQPIANRESH